MAKHISVKLDSPIEFVNVVPVNPLISKCQIKVCYVGEQPNRNGSIITKEVATEIANSIPGSPIVGYYNEKTEDFVDHAQELNISDDGELKFVSKTRPYGFVDLNAKVWFQKFLDDGADEHEYLMTEGYLWTGQYPECQRVIEEGNNQSMELDEKSLKGFWTKDDKGISEFFIINEAIMSKLCILGEEVEPCFEGAGVAERYVHFSFDDNFKTELFSMMEQMKEILNEGGTPVFSKYAVEIGDSLWNPLYEAIDHNKFNLHGVYESEGQKFAVLQSCEDEKFYKVNFSFDNNEFSISEDMEDVSETYDCEAQFSLEDIQAFYHVEEQPEQTEEEVITYNLEEIPEYVTLKTSYSTLETQYNELNTQFQELTAQLNELTQFKQGVEREQKQKMIDSFYMLSDEDKKDVIENIDTYSLDDIEAKLSIICVRNKVSFDLSNEGNHSAQGVITYNLGDQGFEDSAIPAWVKALQDTANSKK